MAGLSFEQGVGAGEGGLVLGQPTGLVHCCLQLRWEIPSALSAQAVEKGPLGTSLGKTERESFTPKYSL